MKNKFDADHEFDRAAREAFENFQMPFDNKDWDSFHAAYEEDKKKAKLFPIGSLLSFKGGALTLIFSLSACVLVYGVYYTYSTFSINPNSSKNNNKTHITPKMPKSEVSNDNILANNLENLTTTAEQELGKEDAQILAQTNENSIPNSLPQKNIVDNHNSKFDKNQAAKTSNIIEKNKNLSDLNTAFDNPSSKYSATNKYNSNTLINSINNNTSVNNKSENTNKNSQDNSDKNSNINDFATTNEQNISNTDLVENAFSNYNENNEQSAINPISKENIILANWDLDKISLNKKKKINPDFELKKTEPLTPFVRQFRFGMLTGVENQSRNTYGKSGPSFTFGVLGEVSLSKLLSLQMGLNLSVRKYENDYVFAGDNGTQSSYISEVSENRKTHQQLIVIPVALQWNLHSNKLWRVYVQTGINTYFNLSQYYSGTRETFLEQENGSVRFSSNIAKNEYQGSILQEKAFKDNIFFNVQLALGIERKLSNSWSLFIQPHMQYSINAMNSFGDKGYTLALHVGAKTTLQK